jgi:hypothetical protein
VNKPHDRSNWLAELAHQINVEHEAIAKATQSALAHAFEAGKLLLEAKQKLKHGEWLDWLQANCTISPRTATHYMRLAKSQKSLANQIGNVADLGVNEALRALAPAAGPPDMKQALELELEAIDPRIKISPTGLSLPEDLGFDAWLTIGKLLQTIPDIPRDPNERPNRKRK